GHAPKLRSRLSGRHPRRKFPGALELADRLSNWSLKQEEATRITGMTLIMACWKQNEFSDSACSKEIETFLDCVEKQNTREKVYKNLWVKTPDSKQINKLLKRFAHITHSY
uniref:CHCH domain-containing protein n=1 Tax=Salvator merianae TaxID=96440 RepID=A0A8D0EFR7_SALMN